MKYHFASKNRPKIALHMPIKVLACRAFFDPNMKIFHVQYLTDKQSIFKNRILNIEYKIFEYLANIV